MKRLLQVAFGVLIAGALVWVTLRGVDPDELLTSLSRVHVGWLLVAQVAIWVTFWLRIFRWSYIIRAVHPATFRSMFSATQIGFLVNFTIGMRLGELVRPIVLSRLSGIGFSKAIAVNTLDRVTDLIGLMAVLLVSVLAWRPVGDVTLPPGTFGIAKPPSVPASIVVSGGKGAAVFLVLVLGCLVVVYMSQNWSVRVCRRIIGVVSTRLANWACGMLEQFSQGLHVFKSVGDMTKSISWSLLTWGCFLASYVALFHALDIPAPWYASFVLQSMLAFFVSAPGVPGLVGQFHIPIVTATLMVTPGAQLADCIALAIIAHASNLLPVLVLGIYCLYREGFSFLDLSREGARINDDVTAMPQNDADSR